MWNVVMLTASRVVKAMSVMMKEIIMQKVVTVMVSVVTESATVTEKCNLTLDYYTNTRVARLLVGPPLARLPKHKEREYK